jgi:3-oxoadipate CoA-transferase alpha subunit
MIDKIAESADAALQGVADGATVLVSGFGDAGMPHQLLQALLRQGARELTVITNNAGIGATGIGALLAAGRVRKLVCSFPRANGPTVFDDLYARGAVELELVPQGTLSERIRAAAAGIGGFFTRTGAGTQLAEGKETREIDGHTYVFESPFRSDLALIKAERGDRWGNLTYRLSARNFGPVMAAAAARTVAQVSQIVELGGIDPEHVVTPGIFVDKVWRVA